MLGLFLLGSLALHSQFEPYQSGGEFSHYLGVQVNPLLRQVISLGNAPSVNNPFLLKYGLHFNESGSEILVGVGYEGSEIIDENDLKSETSNLNARLGFSKKIKLGARMELGLGGDVLYQSEKIRTFNIQSFGFGSGLDSTITTSTTTRSGWGVGPQINFSVYLAPQLLIGTEATYYFRETKNKQNISIKNFRQPSPFDPLTVTTDALNEESEARSLNLALPVAIFLIFKF